MTKTTATVIVIDDEISMANQIKSLISSRCHCNVLCFTDGRQAYKAIESDNSIGVVILDWLMPYPGKDVLQYISTHHPDVRIIVTTGLQDTDTVVYAMKNGARDFLTKPFDSDRLVTTVKTALENFEWQRDYQSLQDRILFNREIEEHHYADIIHRSRDISSLILFIDSISKSRHPVTITGETGVGKEVFANAIHRSSGVTGQFVAVNVAGLDDHMFSDTLFGHKKGAFSGATESRDGLVKKAEGGTLFLDEIGDLGKESQVKLLRFLQEGQYYRLGSDAIQTSNVRIIAATNVNLNKSETFRQDLYYRLQTHHVQIPPLRERIEDIPALVNHFIAEESLANGYERPEVSPELMKMLQTYSYPGNVRELRNIVHDMIARNRVSVLTPDHCPLENESRSATTYQKIDSNILDSHPLCSIMGRFPTIEEMEDYMIDEAMAITGNNQSSAALLLGIARPTLNKRLKRRE